MSFTRKEMDDFWEKCQKDFDDIDNCSGHKFEEVKPGVFKCNGCPLIDRR